MKSINKKYEKLESRIIDLEHFEPEKAQRLREKLDILMRGRSDLETKKYRETNKINTGIPPTWKYNEN